MRKLAEIMKKQAQAGGGDDPRASKPRGPIVGGMVPGGGGIDYGGDFDYGDTDDFPRPPAGGPRIVKPPIDPPPIEPPIMCFVAGTKIDMADGSKKAIENIVVGDEVIALGNNIDKVSYVHDIPEDDRQLWTINNRITATDSHAFLTKEGWKSNNSKLSNRAYNDYGIKVKDLQIGDELITNDGVEKVTTLENQEDFVKVYNFTTSNTHTYLVDGVVSHNKLPPGLPPIGRPPPPPPDNRIIAGLGGYLSPSEIESFVNPPVPSNEAGIMDMARLLQQQRDTFGGMLTYAPPPDDGGGGTPPSDPPPPPPPDDPPPDGPPYDPPPDDPPIDGPPYVPPFVPPYRPPIDGPPIFPPIYPPIDGPPIFPPIYPPIDGPIDGPPIDFPPIFPPIERPPITIPGLPGILPIEDIGGGLPPQDFGFGSGVMPPRPPVREPRPPVKEPVLLPPKPPSIGGVGGRDFEEKRSVGRGPTPPPVIPGASKEIQKDVLGKLPIDRRLIDYGFGPGIMPPIPDNFRIEDTPPTVSRPSEDFLTGGLPKINLPARLPVPRLPTGMETLVSPEILMGRGRGRLR